MSSNTQNEALQQRLAALEQRMARLEQRLAPPAPSQHGGEFTFSPAPGRPRPSRMPARPAPRPLPITQILGWGGVAALVLAAAYLIKLGIDLGWLTPARQVLLAVLAGCGLIGGGVALRRADRQYASLLPAGGAVILFLSAYAAHLYYRLIDFPLALSAVVVVCLLSLWLCRLFESQLYAFFAVCGSYSAPLLLPGLRASVAELALYYSAWSLLFCVYSLWFAERRIYLLAAMLALLGFDVVWYLQWHNVAVPPWQQALAFQWLQFTIFACCTAYFTMRHDEPLDRDNALAHVVPLLLFYVLTYGLLDRFLPSLAPWISLASLFVVLILYLLVRFTADRSLPGGELILGAYAALVLLHAGYLELLPDGFAPMAGLVVGVLLVGWMSRQPQPTLGQWALLGAGLIVFGINLLRAVSSYGLERVIAGDYLALAYAAELYVGAALLRHARQPYLRSALLYTGHLAAMAAPVHLFDSRLLVSLCWAILAVSALLFSLRLRDRLLGQSALFIFAASAAKLLLYDLAGSAPLVRIGSLLVLGVSFYLGGWLYRKVGAMEEGEDS